MYINEHIEMYIKIVVFRTNHILTKYGFIDNFKIYLSFLVLHSKWMGRISFTTRVLTKSLLPHKRTQSVTLMCRYPKKIAQQTANSI